MITTVKYTARLMGLRPMMFDRYSGDNSTQLPASEKMYLTPEHHLIMPAINLYSMLVSENDSVVKRLFGKMAKTIALGIKSYTQIEPYEIPIFDDNGPVKFTGWNEQISKHYATARVKKTGGGFVPMPKERPLLALPWYLEFQVIYQENKHCSLENLRQAFEFGGVLGLGTFRPFFGRYELSEWKEV